MSITYEWNVIEMPSLPEFNGSTNVVRRVNWVCAGSDSASPLVLSALVTGTTELALPEDGAPVTPYEQLTRQQVLGWIWAAGVDKDAIEAAVQAQIANKFSPAVVSPSLPWATEGVQE